MVYYYHLGNDAAIVLAEAVSGNVDDFVKLMNKKAKEIGCLNTHFSNPHGFYSPNHYSTPYDMALILKYAMKYDKFREIVETKTWELPITNKSNSTRILKNTNRLLDENYSVFYKYALGGKTGYTIESRGTYVGYAKKDDKLIIVANFDGSQNINGQNARFLDAITLFNYGFDNFNEEKIIDKSTFNYTFTDENENKKYIITLKDDIYSLTKSNNFLKIEPRLLFNYNSENNLSTKYILHIYGNNLDITNDYDTNITTKSYTSNKTILNFLSYIILIILVIIFTFILLRIRKTNFRKKVNK